MRNITGQAVIGDDLYGREYELTQGKIIKNLLTSMSSMI